MSNKELIFIPLLLIIASCSTQRRIQTGFENKNIGLENYCDSLKTYNSLYISKIDTKITIGENNYNARATIYYLPDSLFFVSVVNAGFEIIRIGVLKDSTVFINRPDKTVIVYKKSDLGYQPPVSFDDFELLINRNIVCKSDFLNIAGTGELIIDHSVQNIDKKIYFLKEHFVLEKFEYFQKKTNEYVVGERSGNGKFVIYSNYIVDDLKIETLGGNIEYNKVLNIDLTVNKDKYDFLYF